MLIMNVIVEWPQNPAKFTYMFEVICVYVPVRMYMYIRFDGYQYSI